MAQSYGGGIGGYSHGGGTQSGGGANYGGGDGGVQPWSLDKLKRLYTDYLGSKREEIDEQQDARRFRHGSQWTSEEVTQLNARRQPITTINKVSRKIHGVIGVLARLKQDPKAFPRTPKHEQGAELATAVIRFPSNPLTS